MPRRVLTIPVTLEPGRSYEFWLDGPDNRGFASEERVPREPVRVRLATRAG